MKANNLTAGNWYIKLCVSAILILIFFLNACQKKSDEFILGEEFIESQTDLNLIDTLSLSFSSVIFDTVATSGTGTLLIGSFHDETFGKIESRSYFQIGPTDDFSIGQNETYDSLKLVLRYNGYYFGDTTETQKISVHQVTEQIQYDDDTYRIGSKTSFSYAPNPIGEIVYAPRPHADTLAIKIDDVIGQDFFRQLSADSETMTNDERFLDYFPGLLLRADEGYEGCILGFNANTVKLILYTHESQALKIEKRAYTFALYDTSMQFNRITHDFSATPLNPLVEQRDALSSTQTGGSAYIQGGTGVSIRVDIPSLSEVLMFERGKIVQALLSISPSRNNSDDNDLPSTLYIYETGKQNKMLSVIALSTLTTDALYDEETAYHFDVTNYLTDELADSYVDPEKGFLITLSSTALKTTFSNLIVDSQSKNTKLKLYYLSY